jgi:hypothetical protein
LELDHGLDLLFLDLVLDLVDLLKVRVHNVIRIAFEQIVNRVISSVAIVLVIGNFHRRK